MNSIEEESQLVPRAWSHPGAPRLRCSPSWSPSPGHSQPPLPPATQMRPQRGTGHGTSYPKYSRRYSIFYRHHCHIAEVSSFIIKMVRDHQQ